jgi:Mn-dependent DtxR family transcriptional regulator
VEVTSRANLHGSLGRTQPDLTIAAMLDGATTSTEIADELGVSGPHARVVINRLQKEGAIRWTGRRMAREGCAGWGKRVYEVVGRPP